MRPLDSTVVLPGRKAIDSIEVVMISANRATPFKIHDENGGKFTQPVKSSSKGLGDFSVAKTAPKSQRKALSSISNNQLNARGLTGVKEKPDKEAIKESKPSVHFALGTPLQIEKEPELIDAEEMKISGPYIKFWDEVPDEAEQHAFEREKADWMIASDFERKADLQRESSRDLERYEFETRALEMSLEGILPTMNFDELFQFDEDKCNSAEE